MRRCQWPPTSADELCDVPDPQVRASIHLTFGRLEGRAGHLRTALRHFAVARQLVAEDPNELLASSIDLDESSVHFF